jgi:hypothetical protein
MSFRFVCLYVGAARHVQPNGTHLVVMVWCKALGSSCSATFAMVLSPQKQQQRAAEKTAAAAATLTMRMTLIFLKDGMRPNGSSVAPKMIVYVLQGWQQHQRQQQQQQQITLTLAAAEQCRS